MPSAKSTIPRIFGRVLFFILAFGLSCPGAVQLFVEPSAGQVSLHWPTGAVTYSLQSSTNVAATNAWVNVTNAPAISGQFNLLTLAAGEPHKFYRLRAPSATAPAIPTLEFPPGISFGSTGEVSLGVFDPDGDIHYLEVTLSNALGVGMSRLPAPAFAAMNHGGLTNLPLSLDKLAFGENWFTVRLRDQQGLWSAPYSFNVPS